MPAYVRYDRRPQPRERFVALAAVAAVQLAMGVALLIGLRVPVSRPREVVRQLISVTLAKPPPPPIVPPPPKPRPDQAAAPKAVPDKPGGLPGPRPAHVLPSVTPIVALKPNAPPSGGGTGTGPASGSGAGGGAGGMGYGAGAGGGTDLELISGDIGRRDYPRHLGNAGIGGTVSVSFTVEVNGRASGCRVTRSSGIPELDALTCRLIAQRFIFRPATDRYGRPVSEVVDWDQEWIPHGR